MSNRGRHSWEHWDGAELERELEPWPAARYLDGAANIWAALGWIVKLAIVGSVVYLLVVR